MKFSFTVGPDIQGENNSKLLINWHFPEWSLSNTSETLEDETSWSETQEKASRLQPHPITQICWDYASLEEVFSCFPIHFIAQLSYLAIYVLCIHSSFPFLYQLWPHYLGNFSLKTRDRFMDVQPLQLHRTPC